MENGRENTIQWWREPIVTSTVNGSVRPSVEGKSAKPEVVILGAGPAGLTAAYELSRMGVRCVVLERDSTPGGLARTVDYKGYLFDIGGHRFYTKAPLIERLWADVLGEDFLTRPRLSRIYYRSKFFHYPLDPLDVIQGLGPFEAFKCALSYLKCHL